MTLEEEVKLLREKVRLLERIEVLTNGMKQVTPDAYCDIPNGFPTFTRPLIPMSEHMKTS